MSDGSPAPSGRDSQRPKCQSDVVEQDSRADMKRKMSHDIVNVQNLGDVSKYKQKIHDLQKQLNIRDKEILMRQAKLKESHEIEL